MDQVKEIKTSEGHSVFIKSVLSRKECKEINLIAKSVIKVDTVTGTTKEVTLADLTRATRLVLNFLVIRISNPDGTDAKNIEDTIDNMLQEDEDALLIEADAITEAASVSKKNVTTT